MEDPSNPPQPHSEVLQSLRTPPTHPNPIPRFCSLGGPSQGALLRILGSPRRQQPVAESCGEFQGRRGGSVSRRAAVAPSHGRVAAAPAPFSPLPHCLPAAGAAVREIHRHRQQAHGRRRGAAPGAGVPRLGDRDARLGGSLHPQRRRSPAPGRSVPGTQFAPRL